MPDNAHYLMPALIPALAVPVLLLQGLWRTDPEQDRSRTLLVSVALVALSVFAAYKLAVAPDNGAFVGRLFYFDPLARFFVAFSAVATVFALLLGRSSREIDADGFPEYAALCVAVCFGMVLMATAVDLVMAYIAFETVSLSSYVLAAFRRGSAKSREAGLKYVIYGGVASGIMVFGLSMLYGMSGDTSFDGVAAALRAAFSGAASPHATFALLVSLLLVLTGLGFKIAVAPFHMWCPDVYEGAPTPFTAFLSVGPKAAGFVLVLRVFSDVFTGVTTVRWEAILGVIAAVTMTAGNLTAIPQDNVKRLLAFSSIAHAGYLLMGVVVLGTSGASALLLYLVVYLFMNLGAFAVVQIVADSEGSEDISAFRGLGFRSPALAVAMAVLLFSLVGLPPLAGFIGKWYIFAAVMERGGFWNVVMVVIAVINSAISLYYYARIVKAMFLDKAATDQPVRVSPLAAMTLALLVLPTLLLGLYWEPVRAATQAATGALSLK